MSAEPSVASAADATALRLAQAHPGAWLPCPRCAASLKAPNLEAHLTKVHASAASGSAARGELVLRGRDVAVVRLLVALFVVTFLGLLVALALTSGNPSLQDAAAAAFGVVLLAVFAGLVASYFFGALTSTLEVHRDRLVLRYALGRLTRELRLPARIEIGRYLEGRPRPGMHAHEHADELVDAGAYLRLVGDGSPLTVTVANGKGTAFRKHWSEAGWRSAGTTRRTDITLRPPDCVVLEYALAEAGLLEPRPPGRPVAT